MGRGLDQQEHADFLNQNLDWQAQNMQASQEKKNGNLQSRYEQKLKELKEARTTTSTVKVRSPFEKTAHLRLKTVDLDQHGRGSYLNETTPLADLSSGFYSPPATKQTAYRDILCHASTNPKF